MKAQKINVLESVISVKGKIFHNDGRRRIDLKKPIKDLFEPLENQQNIQYMMELCLSKKRLLERTKELLDQEVIPVLFYFEKSEDFNNTGALDEV